MEFGISTLCLGDAPVSLDRLEKLRRNGFARIELHAARPSFDFHDKPLVRSVARWFSENELPPPSLHLPFEEELRPGMKRPLSVIAPAPLERQYAMDEVKRCLEFLEQVDIAYVVLHVGVAGQPLSPPAFDNAYGALAAIQSFSGARVLMENLAGGIAVPERIQEFIRVAQLSDAGICYDIGHGSIAEAFEVLPSALHLDDNDGLEDLHQWPLEGIINWPMFVDRLVTANYDGPLILEARDERLGRGVEAVRRLQDLIDEARNSIEEFRLRYRLPHTNPEEN